MLYQIAGGVVPMLRHPLSRSTARGRAILALACAATFFGASTVASKALLDHLAPFTLAFGRFAIALVVLLALCHRAGVRPKIGGIQVALGTTGVALPFVLQNVGLQFSTAVETILVIEGGIPIITALLGAAFLGERLGGRRLAALLFTVSGVVVILLQGAGGGGAPVGLGSLLALGAACSFAVYTVLGQRLFGTEPLLAGLTGSVAVGVLLMAPCAAVEVALRGPGTMTLGDGLLLLYLGIGGSAGTQLLWARGMADLEAGEVAIFGTLMPVVGVASAALLLGESITLVQAGGAVVVATGLYLAGRRAVPDRVANPPAMPTRPVAERQRVRPGGRSVAFSGTCPPVPRGGHATLRDTPFGGAVGMEFE